MAPNRENPVLSNNQSIKTAIDGIRDTKVVVCHNGSPLSSAPLLSAMLMLPAFSNRSITLVRYEAPGANCANGGRKVQTGLDDGTPSGQFVSADDGRLNLEEVDTTTYKCD